MQCTIWLQGAPPLVRNGQHQHTRPIIHTTHGKMQDLLCSEALVKCAHLNGKPQGMHLGLHGGALGLNGCNGALKDVAQVDLRLGGVGLSNGLQHGWAKGCLHQAVCLSHHGFLQVSTSRYKHSNADAH